MIAYDFCKGCRKVGADGLCTSYTQEGVNFRIRYGDCYLGSKGIMYELKAATTKARIGQQKQKKGR